MRLTDAITAANNEYEKRRLAVVKAVEDEEVEWRGHTLSPEGQPVRRIALALVQTRNPASTIRTDGEVDPLTLDLLGSVAAAGGLAGLIWLNAGAPAILSGPGLVNAVNRLVQGQRREDAGLSVPLDAYTLRWEQFTPLAPHGGAIDYLTALKSLSDAVPAKPQASP